MKKQLFRWMALAAAISGAAISGAIVNGFGLEYIADYSQDSDNPPRISGTLTLGYISADTNGDLLAANLLAPTGVATDFIDVSYNAGTTLYAYSDYYPDIATLLSHYPSGNYKFRLTAGGAGAQTATLHAYPADFPIEDPYLNGGTYSALQNSPSNTAAPVTWPVFSHVGAATTLSNSFELIDYTAGGTIPLYVGGDQNYSSATIPAEAMISGHYYSYALSYYCETLHQATGFGGQAGILSFGKQTGGFLHCKADPGTVSGQLTLEGYYYPNQYPLHIEFIDASGTIVDQKDIKVGVEGHYAVDTTATGVVTVTFRGPHFLRRAVPNVDLSVGQDSVNPSLTNGDCDDNGIVNINDYGILSDAFNTTAADASFDARAELNGDGIININDYAILSDSFNKVAD